VPDRPLIWLVQAISEGEMKAFLSHSSRDKAIITAVADELGAANVELDSETFDRGIINIAAIQEALKRSNLYVLFLTKDALASGAVRYEAILAQEKPFSHKRCSRAVSSIASSSSA
jgi:TIR domain